MKIAKVLLLILIIYISLLCIFGSIFIFTSIIAYYYKSAITYTWFNSLAPCGVEMCPSSIDNSLQIPVQIPLIYNNKVARYCADLVVRVGIAVDNQPIIPSGLTEELKIYNNKQDPIFGTLWSSGSDKNIVTWLAFRGTDELISEWVKDFHYSEKSYQKPKQNSQANLTFLRSTIDTTQPLAHQGFLDIYMKIREELIDKLTDLKPSKLIITGHSLGGAIAIISGLDLTYYFPTKVIVYTFASPRVGNIELANLITKDLNLFRIVNTVDLVPTLPLAICPNFKDFKSPFIYMDAGILKTFSSNWFSISNNHILSNYIEHIPPN